MLRGPLVTAFATLLLLRLSVATVEAQRLPTRIFTTVDGLANNIVNHIVHDSRGFLWFCTREGLSRFDGHDFVTYGLNEGLSDANVRNLLETRDGAYWLATVGGLVRFDPSGEPTRTPQAGVRPMFTRYGPDGPDAARETTSLLEDRSGVVWVGTLGGLYRLRIPPAGAPRLERLPEVGGAEVLSLMEHPSGEVWAGTNRGIYRVLTDGRVEHAAAPDGVPGDAVTALLTDREARTWAGTTQGGLALITRHPATRAIQVQSVLTFSDGLPSNWIHDLLQTLDGRIWLATPGGAAVLVPAAAAPAGVRVVPVSLGLTSGPLDLVEDRNRQLWAATNAGAARVLSSRFTVFTAQDGVPAASSLLETRSGDLVAMTAGATSAGGVVFDGHQVSPVRLPIAPEATSWGWNQMMLVDRDGDWWIGSREGVLRFRGITHPSQLSTAVPTRLYSRRTGLAADVVIRLFEDSHGDVWIATVGEGHPSGLSRWERATGRLRHYDAEDGLALLQRAYVCAIAEDREGNVWMGFNGDGGVVRYRRGRFQHFGADAGIAPGSIRNLLVDSTGRLWMASARSGLLRVDRPTDDQPLVTRYTTADGLSSDIVSAVVEDAQGRIYAATARAIDRLEPRANQITSFPTAEGLPIGEIHFAHRDRNGGLWFGCNSGLFRFLPGDDPPAGPPAMLITALTINGQSRQLSAVGHTELQPVEVPPGPASLQVNYVAPGSGPGDRLRYQIMLEGVDRTWSAPTAQRIASYANIGAGTYRFLVRAVDAAHGTSEPAGFRVTVLAPLWQRWWFLSLAAVVVAAAGHAGYRHRLRRMVEIANMRGRIATDLHDDIGTNLTRIAILSEVVRRQQRENDSAADGRLATIAEAARESMSAMSDIVWAISPDRDSLTELTGKMREYAEELLTPTDIALEFTVAEGANVLALATEIRRDVYLIFKEAITNAARHSQCSRIDVHVAASGRALAVTVDDNGRGFDPECTADGNGLANMRRRAARVNGRLTVTSSPGRGSTVRLQHVPGGPTRRGR
jgi:ligand-binding sensor domain-containing protein/signal transduction histidine kinase